ncbi:MAG: putative rho GTPase-activating protein 39 [Streblomastix strix]|uniref:Putative rho GTPase-activating protein 39 n=1 Tax=Streblomastix strix TaxID=222440 RepID=A0A5J4W093_9EUKA|nr:MAG: putative rho GTPase-activating protein 39 [Streblomastix strix]
MLIEFNEEQRKQQQLRLTRILAYQIAERGFLNQQLRNEIYCQLIKQTTVNIEVERQIQVDLLVDAVRKGWQLIMICCATFAPTKDYETVLFAHIDQAIEIQEQQINGQFAAMNVDISLYAKYALNRLLFSIQFGGILKLDNQKIIDFEKFNQMKRIFNCSLTDIMVRQSMLPTHEKDILVPTVLIFLINKLSQTGGLKTQGIFRLSVPVSELDHAIVLLNLNDYSNPFFSQVLTSPHAYAVLLKRWFKSLDDPIIPYSLYEDALNIIRPPILKDANYKQISVNEFMNKKLPQTNNLILKYLILILKDEYTDENMLLNMMVVQNYATILASTLIRSNQEDKYIGC